MAKKFVKCGEKAFSFSDPYCDFNIAKGDIKELETPKQRRSKKIKNALRGGHLESVTEADYEKWLSSKTGTKPDEDSDETLLELLEEKTKDELEIYYKDNFGVDEDDIKTFSKLTHPKMVKEIISLSEED